MSSSRANRPRLVRSIRRIVVGGFPLFSNEIASFPANNCRYYFSKIEQAKPFLPPLLLFVPFFFFFFFFHQERGLLIEIHEVEGGRTHRKSLKFCPNDQQDEQAYACCSSSFSFFLSLLVSRKQPSAANVVILASF